MLEMRVSWELGLVIQFHVLMREFIGPPSLAIFSLEYNILTIEKRTKAKLFKKSSFRFYSSAACSCKKRSLQSAWSNALNLPMQGIYLLMLYEV